MLSRALDRRRPTALARAELPELATLVLVGPRLGKRAGNAFAKTALTGLRELVDLHERLSLRARPASVAAIRTGLRTSVPSCRAEKPPERAGASGSGGSPRRITIVEASLRASRARTVGRGVAAAPSSSARNGAAMITPSKPSKSAAMSAVTNTAAG